MLNIENGTNGYYLVGNETFTNKLYAVKKGIEKKLPVRWCYFDDIFEKIPKYNLSSFDLEMLYKERAQQLRDEYDYLVLYYSGGSDSWNVLNTFLKNKIKLDCVFVHQPSQIENKNIYTPNNIDKSGFNQFSEWDFVIKPDLEYLTKFYPEIKIEIGDWTSTLFEAQDNFDNLMDTTIVTYNPNLVRLLKNKTFCKFELEKIKQGKTVGCIFGVDKPFILEKDDNVFFMFFDRNCMVEPTEHNPNGVEYFYITPKFPILTVVQSYKVFQWFKQNEKFRHLIQHGNYKSEVKAKQTKEQEIAEQNLRFELVKKIIYPGWNLNKFQADKPHCYSGMRPEFLSWEQPLAKIPEFQVAGSKWNFHWKSFWNSLDTTFFPGEGEVPLHYTKLHFLCKSGD